MVGTTASGTSSSMPPASEMFKMIMELKQGQEALKQELSSKNSQILAMKAGKSLKVQPPDQFDGRRDKLKVFIAQSMQYVRYNHELLANECDKVMLIGGRLIGSAFDWYEAALNDYNSYPAADQEDETRKIFGSLNYFLSRLNMVFGNIDEEREAERRINELKQKGSASKYASEFQQLAGRLNWTNKPLIAQFYRGLKDSVKDEVARVQRPSDFQEMVMLAVQIDNRLHERKMEKSYGSDATSRARKPIKETKTYEYRPSYRTTYQQQGGDPMEIGNVEKRPPKKPYTEQQKKWMSQGACLKCGKMGHYAKDHDKRQVNMARKDPEDPTSDIQLKHATLHFSACYQDSCQIHQSEKDGAGWYPRKPKKEKKTPESETELAPQSWELDDIGAPNPEGESASIVPYVETDVLVDGYRLKATVDSGCHVNAISTDTVQQYQFHQNVKTSPYKVTGLDGSPLGEGRVTRETRPMMLRIGENEERIIFDIMPMQTHQIVLGTPWLRKNNPQIDWKSNTVQLKGTTLKNDHHPRDKGNLEARSPTRSVGLVSSPEKGTEPVVEGLDDKKSLPMIPREYQDLSKVFEDLKGPESLPDHQPWDCEIPLVEGKQVQYSRLYQLSTEQQKVLKAYIEDMLKRGLIRESKSPAGYPIIFVPKSEKEERACVDFRQLNDITVKDRYPLPLISELQDQLREAKIFTKLDIKEAFHQVRMKEGEEWKTTFRTRYGSYEYLVMPFGLTNAPAVFQRLINNALREYLDVFVIAYLDDIIIYSKDPVEHVEHVRKVLKKLLEWKLRVKLKKSEFHTTKTAFLGHVIEPGRIGMDPRKVASIVEWPEPTTIKDVQSFLGLANYYRRFVEGYSQVVAPLLQLTHKDQRFEWTGECTQAFRDLKKRFTTAPILTLFKEEREVILETDASDYALSACLHQPDEKGRMHPVAFYSRKFQSAELNYDVHDKELLAIIEAFREWKAYLTGAEKEIQVITDHKNLLYFTTTKELSRRQARWAEKLARFKFRISYRKGSENNRADALSRRPDYRQSEKFEHQLLRKDEDGLRCRDLQVGMAYKISSTRENEILEAYGKDTMYEQLCKDAETQPHIQKTEQGHILFFGKLYVPTSQRKAVLQENHDWPGSGHQGRTKTVERIQQKYYFPNLRKEVEEYIRKCTSCAVNKATHHAPNGSMGRIPIPERPWEVISMDWITKLPKSREPLTGTKYDSIWVIACRLTKYAIFIPYLESSTTEALLYSFQRNIVADHGMPEVVISDRDKWLTSKFWTSLMNQLGTKQAMTSAYHPQANGQAERINQVLEEYLRHFLNYRQDNWVGLLPTAQYAYNSSAAEATGCTPYAANYGFTPPLYGKGNPDEQVAQEATERIQEIKETHQQMKQDLQFVASRMAKYYNKNRLSEPTYQEGDKVFLTKRNIKTRRPSAKLDHIRMGPFEVERKIGNLHYKLKLPMESKIHPEFHVALLERAPPETPLQTRISIIPEEDEYEVEEILDHRKEGRSTKYLVKWKGYTNAENTWEPETNLTNCEETLKRYHQTPTTEKRTSSQEDQLQASQREVPNQRNQEVRRILMVAKTWEEKKIPPRRASRPRDARAPRSIVAHGSASLAPSQSLNQVPSEEASFQMRHDVAQPRGCSLAGAVPQEAELPLQTSLQETQPAPPAVRSDELGLPRALSEAAHEEHQGYPLGQPLARRDQDRVMVRLARNMFERHPDERIGWAKHLLQFQLEKFNSSNPVPPKQLQEAAKEVLELEEEIWEFTEYAQKDYYLYHTDRKQWIVSPYCDDTISIGNEEWN